MIEINGEIFLKQAKGNNWKLTFKKRKRGVLFFENGEPIMFLVANRYNERFFVAASELDGKIWYSFALTDKLEKRFGLEFPNDTKVAREIWDNI